MRLPTGKHGLLLVDSGDSRVGPGTRSRSPSSRPRGPVLCLPVRGNPPGDDEAVLPEVHAVDQRRHEVEGVSRRRIRNHTAGAGCEKADGPRLGPCASGRKRLILCSRLAATIYCTTSKCRVPGDGRCDHIW